MRICKPRETWPGLALFSFRCSTRLACLDRPWCLVLGSRSVPGPWSRVPDPSVIRTEDEGQRTDHRTKNGPRTRHEAPGTRKRSLRALHQYEKRCSHNQISNILQLESQLFTLVGPQLIKMGHKASSSNGSPVGGFEGIMWTPDPSALPGCAPTDVRCTAPINGFYRAGSNFREDGQAVGY